MARMDHMRHRLVLTLPAEMFARLQERAAREDRSTKAEAGRMLREALERPTAEAIER